MAFPQYTAANVFRDPVILARSERGQSEARLQAQLEAAAARNDALGSEARELAAAKCELEAEVGMICQCSHEIRYG